jgi:hypothetical protein
MAQFNRYHGITLAANSYIENLVVERVAADIVAVEAGRVFYNETDKVLRFSSLNGAGAVVTETVATASDLAARKAELAANAGAAEIGFAGHTGVEGEFAIGAKPVAGALVDLVSGLDKEISDRKDLSADLASQLAGKGVSLVGYEGRSTANYTIPAGTGKAALDSIVDEINALIANGSASQADVQANYLNKTDGTAQTVESDVTFKKDLIVNGNLNVAGATVTVHSEEVTFADNVLVLNSNVVSGAPTENAGLSVMRGDEGALDFIVWDETQDAVTIPVWDATLNAGAGGFAQKKVADHDYVTVEAVDKINQLLTDLADDSAGKGAALVAYAGHTAGSTSVAAGDVDAALDAIVVAIEDARNSGGSATQALQTELDASQAAIGLAADGTLAAVTGTNYINGISTVLEGIVALDGKAKDNADAVAAETARAKGVEGVLTDLTTGDKTNLVSAINEVKAGVTAEKSRAEGVEGDLADLNTADKSNLVAAINSGRSEALNATDTLKTAINDSNASFQSSAPAVTHTIAHGLASPFLNITVLVEGDDGKYRNDIVMITEIDTNTIEVTMTESRNVRASIQSIKDLS